MITYCTRENLEEIVSPSAVIRWTDDDENGSLSATELLYIARAIERAANKMNASLEMRYSLAGLAGNAWCRDCNAALAVYLLATRRGNPAPDQIQEQYEGYLADLSEIRGGRLKVPEVPESHDTTPAVSNFNVKLS